MNHTEAATQITLALLDLEKTSGITHPRTAYVIETYKAVHKAIADADRSSSVESTTTSPM